MSRLLQPILRIALTVLVGGLLSATLARYAPGFGSDEEQLDTRRDASSLQRLRDRQMENGNVAAFYTQSLIRYLKGDLGVSRSLGRPVRRVAGRAAQAYRHLAAHGACARVGARLGGSFDRNLST